MYSSLDKQFNVAYLSGVKVQTDANNLWATTTFIGSGNVDPTKRVGLSLFPEEDGNDLVSRTSQRSPKFRLCVECQICDAWPMKCCLTAQGCSCGARCVLQFRTGSLMTERAVLRCTQRLSTV